MMAKPSALIPSTYAPLLADLKARVRAAQVKAAVAVNRELILLYWHIGREILRAQKAEGWGTKVIERLAKDLEAKFPEMDGFSFRNLMRMWTFANAYGTEMILPQPVARLTKTAGEAEDVQQFVGQSGDPIVPQAVAKSPGAVVLQPVSKSEDAPPEPLSRLGRGSNVILIDKVKAPAVRLWYARKAVEHGWSRPPRSPTPVSVLAVSGAAGAKADSSRHARTAAVFRIGFGEFIFKSRPTPSNVRQRVVAHETAPMRAHSTFLLPSPITRGKTRPHEPATP